MLEEFEIPCRHKKGIANEGETVSDYYPLTKPEITKLLIFAAKNHEDCAKVSKVQVRMIQGIKGMTCPRPVTGRVSDKMVELEHLFVRDFIRGGIPETIDKLYKLMK